MIKKKKDSLIKDQETYYSERSDISLFVTTYNCDSTKPQELLNDEFNKKFFDNWFKVIDSPDIIVVGLQEIVDLERYYYYYYYYYFN